MFHFTSSSFFSFIIFFFFSLILFLLFRQLFLWYFRINENTDSLRRIADSLEEISVTLAADEVVTEKEAVTDDNQEINKWQTKSL